jgi:hypothetical protein
MHFSAKRAIGESCVDEFVFGCPEVDWVLEQKAVENRNLAHPAMYQFLLYCDAPMTTYWSNITEKLS